MGTTVLFRQFKNVDSVNYLYDDMEKFDCAHTGFYLRWMRVNNENL